MSTRFVIEIENNGHWVALPTDVDKKPHTTKEPAVAEALAFTAAHSRQTRVKKIVEKVAFCSPKPAKLAQVEFRKAS